jgi:putative hydrolase of the HAD superfamily
VAVSGFGLQIVDFRLLGRQIAGQVNKAFHGQAKCLCDTQCIMIDALIFDIGGVLLRTNDLEPRRKWERRYGLRDWQLQDLFFNSAVGQAAQVGKATTEDAWAYVAKTLALNASELTELKRDFYVGDVLDRDLIALIQSFRPRYKTAILSNALPDARHDLRDRINSDTFDVLVFSGEEGVRKPDPEIYRRVLRRLRVQAEQAVFVDDVPVNVAAARTLGMNAFQYVTGMNVKEALQKLGVE